MQEIKVSVVVPVYNAAPYLRRCVNSILAQTLREIEIILVDDESGDESLSILREYEKRDARVRVVAQKNGGGGAARNAGLALARGKYLSFLDSDDFFEPDMLEAAFCACEQKKADLCVFRCDLYDEKTDTYASGDWALRREYLPRTEPFQARDFADRAFHAFVGWAWDKLFLREMIVENGLAYQEIRTTNDMLFVFTALVCARRIVTLDRVFAHQRRRETDSLSVTREKSWHCFLDALDALQAFLVQRGLYKTYERGFLNYVLHFSLWNLNTITGASYQKLYNALREEYFLKWRIAEYPESHFFSEGEYGQYRRMVQMPFEIYVVDSMDGYRRSVQRLKKQLAQKGVLDEDSAAAQLKAIQGSLSFKIGRAVTFLPRKIAGALRLFRR